MTSPAPDVDGLLSVWLHTQLLVRSCGRTVDLDAIPAGEFPRPIGGLRAPITLVTGWNPGGQEASPAANRAANVALRTSLEARGQSWRPALGRAHDGSWAEPGFAVGGLTEVEAAALGREWRQLAVYVVSDRDVIVLASDGSFRRSRPRGHIPG
jgi:hypothetical protein